VARTCSTVGAPAIIDQPATAGTREENWDAWLDFLVAMEALHGPPEPPPSQYVSDVLHISTRLRSGG